MGQQRLPVAAAAYGRLPLVFEVATDSSTFIAHGAGYALAVGATGVTLRLLDSAPPVLQPGAEAVPPPTPHTSTVRLALIGADPRASSQRIAPLGGRVSYLTGRDPRRWRNAVLTFARVTYRQIYRGIDLTYYGTQHQLEYAFTVAPFIDPAAIVLRLTTGLPPHGTLTHLDARGDLVVPTGVGTLVQRVPVAYQQGPRGRISVLARYRLDADGSARFALGPYNHSRPLTIDPVVSYATYLGGTGYDQANGVAVDSNGAAYLTGYTASTDFPVTGTPAYGRNAGGYDVFVAKLNPSGTALDYATYLGGSGNDLATAIAVDSSGAAYITGYTNSTNFPTLGSPAPYQGTDVGGYDSFVAKLNPTGSALDYATYLGSAGYDEATAIAVDSSGSAYLAGYTTATNFPTTGSPAPFQGSGSGSVSAFVAKFNPGGTALIYSTYLGASGVTVATGIAVDSSGNAYLTGYTNATSFPTLGSPAPLQGSLAGGNDLFVTKLNATGAGLVYSTYLGGSANDNGTGIAVDSGGDAYVTGYTWSTNYPTAGASPLQAANGGTIDAVVSRLNSTGTALIYSTYLGGAGDDYSNGIALDASGDASIVGYTNSSNFPTAGTAAPIQGSNAGGSDAFVSLLNPAGTALLESTYLGGSGNDLGNAIAVDSSGVAYIVGYTSGAFPTTGSPAPLQGAYQGGTDAFVAKISLAPPATATPSPSPTSTTAATATDPPTATATATGTDTPTSAATATATDMPTSTVTAFPTDTTTTTALPTDTATATATVTYTPVPPTNTTTTTATNNPTATATALPTITATHTPLSSTSTATASRTPLPPTRTAGPTATATHTPVPLTSTATATASPRATATAAATSTRIVNATPTRTGTPRATRTSVPSTRTPTSAPTTTNTLSPTPTVGRTPIPLPTATSTLVPFPTTTTASPSPTDAPTSTPVATDTPESTGTGMPTAEPSESDDTPDPTDPTVTATVGPDPTTSIPSPTPRPGHHHHHRLPPEPRPDRLTIGVTVPEGIVRSTATVTITVQAAANTVIHVVTVIRVDTTAALARSISSAQQTADPLLYHRELSIASNRRGTGVAHLRITVTSPIAVRATLTVRARDGNQVSEHSLHVILLPT